MEQSKHTHQSSLLSYTDMVYTMDCWSQITITNIIIMKTFEIWWELPKCDTERESEQKLLEKSCQQTCWIGLPQAFNLFKKKSGSVKHNKAKSNKWCIPVLQSQLIWTKLFWNLGLFPNTSTSYCFSGIYCVKLCTQCICLCFFSLVFLKCFKAY